jgi:SPP1 gp7 family putative phage head morphogenesis protein
MLRETFSSQADELSHAILAFKSKSIEDYMIDWEKYRIIYNEFGQLTIPDAMSNWANIELEALEVGISFNVLDPNVQTAIWNRSNLFADTLINKTREWLHVIMVDSIAEQEGPYQLEKRIRAFYKDMSKYRATRIARTETIWMQAEGSEQSYIQSGVVKGKSWLCSRDERTCPLCFHLNGKTISLGQNYFNQGDRITLAKPIKSSNTVTFTFDYEEIRHPPSHPRCRCCLVPITFMDSD